MAIAPMPSATMAEAPSIIAGGRRRSASAVHVLDHLDDCVDGLDGDDARLAIQSCVAPQISIEPGAWRPPSDPGRCRGWLALVVVDGLLTRSVEVDGHRAQELLGPGDVLRPWDDDAAAASIPSTSAWRVIEPATIAVLDDRFAARAARWPAITVALLHAAVRSSQSKSAILALTRARRADERLLLLFWHLADRWGRVGADGVHVPLRLTHALLAELVCLRRPTVSMALSDLRERGDLRRLPDGTWRLLPRSGDHLSAGATSTAQAGGRSRQAQSGR